MRSRGERARAENPGANCLRSLLLLSGQDFRDWQYAAFLRVDGRIVGMRFPTEDSTVGVLPRSSHEASSKCPLNPFSFSLSRSVRVVSWVLYSDTPPV